MRAMPALTMSLVALAALGCAGSPGAPTGAFALDRQAAIAAIALPEVSDWSKSSLSSFESDRLRQSAPARRVQAVSNVWNATSATLSAPGRISSAPAYHYMNNCAYWITDNGWLIRRNMATTAVTTYRVSSTDTFPGSAVTLSADGRRAYLCSKQGRFYAVHTATGLPLAGTPVAMGGADTNVTVAPPPFIDALASRADGQAETIYALTQRGTLNRFVLSNGATASPTLTHVQSYTLPVDNTAPYTELFHSAPIVIRGKAVIGTYHRHSSDATLHKGYVTYYDTGAAAFTTGTTTGVLSRKTGVTGPIWAPPSVEFSNALVPTYAFVPTGFVVTMVDLATGNKGQSPPLIVNQTTPTSGRLAGYNYGATGIATVTLAPSTSAVSIGANASIAKDLTTFVATSGYDDSNATPYYGYLKFFVSAASMTSGGTLRPVIDALIRLNCTSSSNRNGTLVPAPSPLRAFAVSNHYATGGSWTAAGMTSANRPTYLDGQAFSLANAASHTAVELLDPGNAYRNNQTYDWSAKGRITAPDNEYSFGFAHPDSPYLPSGGANGQPFRDSAPRFDGGLNPQLILTLAGEGLANPTMSNPVAIDSVGKRIFVANSNALYTVSYRSPSFDGASDPFTSAAFGERANNMSDPAQTYFSLTHLGRLGTAGPIQSNTTPKRYVSNVTAPLWNGVHVYVQDNHPGTHQTSITRFTPGTAPSTANGGVGSAPSLVDSVLLSTSGSDVRAGATYLAYDYRGAHLFAGTYDTTSGSTGGRAWVLTQQ